ncbi:MAG: hypothetical protein ACRYGK_12860 [Janthinobacterium lividum]
MPAESSAHSESGPAVTSRRQPAENPTPLTLPTHQRHAIALGMAINDGGLANHLKASQLIQLSRVCRVALNALDTELHGDRTHARRKAIRKKLHQMGKAECSSRKDEYETSNEVISETLSSLSSNKTKRKQQLIALSNALSGFTHLQMPSFSPGKRPYWTPQAELMACVSGAGNWESLSLTFSKLRAGQLGKKGSQVFNAVKVPSSGMKRIELSIKFSSLDGIDGAALAEFCAGNRNLRTLCLEQLTIDEHASTALLSVMGLSNIEQIQIQGTNLGAVDQGLSLILANHDLEVLTLNDVRIGQESFDTLNHVLRVHPRLTSLTLHNVSKEKHWMGAVFSALSGNEKITTLDLSESAMQDGCSLQLFSGLYANNTLQVLNLTSTGLDDDGAKALGDVLEFNKCLRTLHLDQSCITSTGMQRLLDGLTKNDSLQVLTTARKEFCHEILSRKAVEKLIEVLRFNRSLTILDISGFDLDDESKEVLALVLEDRDKFLTFVCNNSTYYWNRLKDEYICYGSSNRPRSAARLERVGKVNNLVTIKLRD